MPQIESPLPALAPLFVALRFSECASSSPPDAPACQGRVAAPVEPEESEFTEEQTHVGMTKTQVLRAWGESSGRDVTARQEVWVYGNQHMKRFIPYAGLFLNVNTRKVLFRNGRVADFRSTDSGSVWSQAEGVGGGRFSGW